MRLFSVSWILLQALSFASICSANFKCHDHDWYPDYVLVATVENIKINCQTRPSVVFNGTTPGPPLYMKEGQTSWVRVYNHIQDQNLTVHWHGLSQRTAPFSDGTPQVSQWAIAPNEYFDYEIHPDIGDAGSYFYHSHVGFQAVTAHGVLIVEDAQEPPYQYDDDLALFFSDYYPKNDSAIEAGLVANPFKWSGEPEAIAINDKTGNSSFSNATDETCTPYVVKVDPGKTYRLRFISGTAISLVTLGIEGHDSMQIIEADGAYTKPWSTDHVQIGSGQRFSVLFTAKTEAELQSAGKSVYWIRYENRDRPTNVSGYALLQYSTGDNNLPQDLPAKPPITLAKDMTKWAEYSLAALKPGPESFPSLPEVTRTVYITMNQVIPDGGAYVNGSVKGKLEWEQNDNVWQQEVREDQSDVPYLVQVYLTGQTPDYDAAINNNGWDPVSRAFPAKVGEVLDIVWLSNSGPTGGWDFHPMHAHGKHYYDLGSGNGTYNATANEAYMASISYTPTRRDTTMLYRYAVSGSKDYTAGWRAWRIRITEDDIGAWMVHCHILAHMIMGMNTVWVYGDAASILAQYPQQPYIDGYLQYGGSAYGNSSWDPLVNEHY